MVHADIEQARSTASRYRVKPSQRGWHLWRFYGWQSDTCGWRVIVADLKSREDAFAHLASRLGLSEDEPPEPHAPIHAVVLWSGYTEWL